VIADFRLPVADWKKSRGSEMTWLRLSVSRFMAQFRRRRLEEQLAEELAAHLEMLVEEKVRGGMTPEEARYAARREFGGVELTKENYRDQRGWPMLDALNQDLRYGLRMVAKNRGLSATVVTILALGVAANTTIFSLTNGVLLRRPAVHEPDTVMMVVTNNRARGWSRLPVSAPDYLAWREQNRVFESMAGAASGDFTLTGKGEPERLIGWRVSANYFRVLGVSAALGRAFLPGDDQPGHGNLVVLSHGLWERHFGSDPSIVGKNVAINGESRTVVGVLPTSFRLMSFFGDVWTPLIFTPDDSNASSLASRRNNFVFVFARLKPGVTSTSAQAEMSTIGRRLARSYPDTNQDLEIRVMSLQQYIVEDANVRPALTLLMGAVGFVLFIVCSNIAGLLLARNLSRQRELAIRTSLGARTLRIVRQLLVEAMLMGLGGGALGFLMSFGGTHFLRDSLNWNIWTRLMASEVVVDARVLAFALIASVLAALLFGLLPAFQAAKIDLNAALKEGGRSGSSGIGKHRARSSLVISEIAVSILLLVGAGLMIRATFDQVHANPGFDHQGVLTAGVSLTSKKYQQVEKQSHFFEQSIERLTHLPGAGVAAATSGLPLSGSPQVRFRIEGQATVAPDQEPMARRYVVSPDYFRALGIPLVQGRTFHASDRQGAPGVVLVNPIFVNRFLPGQAAVGQRISIERDQAGESQWSEIVGVVGDVNDWPGQLHYQPQIYECYLQQPVSTMTLVVKAGSDPAALASGLREAVWSVDKDQPVGDLEVMSKWVDEQFSGERLMGTLLASFAALALALAALGIYGVIAYSVAQRSHEIGIRMALGAEKGDVLRLVVRQGLAFAAVGVAIGLLGACVLPRLFEGMFQDFKVSSGMIFVITPLVVTGTALVACVLPAHRATKVDPKVALRHE